MIHKCALAVIASRGREVVQPTVNDLEPEEANFIQRHVDELRRAGASDNGARGQFRRTSTLNDDCLDLLLAADDVFLDGAERLVESLAAAMRSATTAKDCVVALVVDGPEAQAEHVTLLKLDAVVEAAQLERLRTGGIKLHVFDDLLPRPGKIQKGWSWPDPRPESEIIIVDKNVSGTTLYFQNAFRINASASAVESEKALVEAIADLPLERARQAAALAREGGAADVIVARIREQVDPGFRPDAPALGVGGRLAGRIRPREFQARKREYSADGIDLHVPLDKLGDVETIERNGVFETRIVTSTPLTPVRQ